MTPPRILFLDHSASLGGAELYLLETAKAYRSHATVLLFEDGPFATRLQEADLDVEVLEAPSLQTARKQGRLWDALRAVPGLLVLTAKVARRARGSDLLFANSQKSLLVGAAAHFLTGTPLLWNLHDLLTPDHFSARNRWLAVGCANLAASHVIANSQASLEAFRDSGGRTPASVVYNGMDAERFQAVDSTRRSQLRDRLGVGTAPLVGVFSRLAPWKGQHVLLRALSTRPNLHALVVGEALFAGDQDYARALRTFVSEHQMEDRVHFLGFRDDIPALMNACDIVAHTSTTPEPFGRVIVEGMLAERPVIATRAGGAREIIDDGVTGRLVPPGDEDALGCALDDLLETPHEAAQLARKGARHARRRFSLRQQIEGITAAVAATVDSDGVSSDYSVRTPRKTPSSPTGPVDSK